MAAIAAAVTLFVLDVTGRLTPHAFERLLVAAVAFLAIDALIERVALLETIEATLDEHQVRIETVLHQLEPMSEIKVLLTRLRKPASLSNRSNLNNEVVFHEAREIDIAGVTLVNLLLEKRGDFEARLRDGASLRILLLSPTSNAWAAWNDTVVNEDTEAHRRTALGILRGLMQMGGGRCEIRDAQYLLPVSLTVVDGARPTGRMVVETIFPGVAASGRPHVVLTRTDDSQWFEFMRSQFAAAWDTAMPTKLETISRA